MNLNTPVLQTQDPRSRNGFQETWYIKLNDPTSQRALWLRITLLISANGFRRIAETWAVYFHRGTNKEVTKLAMKQTHDLSTFSAQDGTLRAGECEMSSHHAKGQLQSKGRTMRWDLQAVPGHDIQVSFIPDALRKLTQITAVSTAEDLRFTGTLEIDGEKFTFDHVAGMQGHWSGPHSAHSWVWGQSNLFVDGNGKPVPFLFEGLTARARVFGGLILPPLSSLYFHYDGKPYAFTSLWDAVRIKSQHSLTEWSFEAERGDLSFRGRAKADLKDFAGLTIEDTNGSLLYCANSKLSDLEVHVYRHGKLENTFYSHGMAAFEIVSREKNPYVPLLV